MHERKTVDQSLSRAFVYMMKVGGCGAGPSWPLREENPQPVTACSSAQQYSQQTLGKQLYTLCLQHPEFTSNAYSELFLLQAAPCRPENSEDTPLASSSFSWSIATE